jgi:hypothetical protein
MEYTIDIAVIFSDYTPEIDSSKCRSTFNAVCWYSKILKEYGNHDIWCDRPILGKFCRV